MGFPPGLAPTQEGPAPRRRPGPTSEGDLVDYASF